MNSSWLIAVVAVLAATIVAAFVPRRMRTLQERAARLAATVGIALAGDVEALVIRRQVRVRRLSIVLGGAAWAVAVGIVLTLGGPQFDVATVWFMNGSIVVGGAIGSAAAAWIDARRRVPPESRRLARDRSVTLGDYVPGGETLLVRALAVVAAVGVTIAVASGLLTVLPGALLAGLCVASLVLFEVGGRLIVGRPQPASNTTELAWDDALRSIDLKAIEVATGTSALYALLGVVVAVTELRGPVHVVGDLGLMAVVLVAVALIALRAARQRQRDRYFLRTLWPATAAEAEANERGLGAEGVQS